MKKHKLSFLALAVLCFTGMNSYADTPAEISERTQNASNVLREIAQISDNSIPVSLLEKSTCIATFPNVVRAAFILGGRYGNGLVSCRVAGGWSQPSFIRLTGGNLGFQIGVNSTDLILVFVNPNASKRLDENNFTLGANASIAAGPVGRNAEAGTDYELKSEVYSYSRSRGLFAGLSLEGAALVVDTSVNAEVYGQGATVNDLLTGKYNRKVQLVDAYVKALVEFAPTAK